MNRFALRAFASVCLVAVTAACAPRTENGSPAGRPVPPQAPDYDQIARTHNHRVDQLRQLHSRGVVEIRWEDEQGRHFEQGNVQIWLSLPHHTALRVEKLGDVLFWLGSDPRQYWLFDLASDETVLYCRPHDEELDTRATGAIGLKPLALLDLMGLTPLPPPLPGAEVGAVGSQPDVHYDETHDAWTIEAAGSGGPMRVFFDRLTVLPERVESLDSDGRTVAVSDPRRYEPVETEGSLSINWPALPTLVDITLPAGQGSLKLALESPTTIVTDQPLDRVFDLDRLKKAMPTDRPGPDVAADQR